MALRFCESFDHYTWSAGNPPTGDLLEKWTSWSASGGGGTTFAAPVSGRNGNGAQLSGNNIEVLLWKTIDDQSTWIVGWAWRKNGAYSGNTPIFKLLDSGGAAQVSLYHDSTAFYLYRGDGSTLLATYSNSLGTNTWYYFEIKWIGSQTVGTYEFRVNGQVVATYSGDTCQGAGTTARTIVFGGDRTQTGTTIIDDIYMNDGVDSGVVGAPNNDYLGDVRIEVLYPNANGTTSQLLGSDGNSTDNYLLVDETTPNDATDYVQSNTVGEKDTYNMGSLATAVGTVFGVQPCPNVRKDLAGTRAFKPVIRSAGVEEDGTEVFLGTSFTMYRNEPFDGDPSGNQWTIASINAMEAGVKVTT
jgi:hypothetical protein